MASTTITSSQSLGKPETTTRKVSSHWKLLKSFINADEKGENVQRVEDKFPKIVSHGVHHASKIHTRKINGKRLKFVAFNSQSNIYATICDEGKITVFFPNGKSRKIKSDERFRGIIYATKSKQCVCWGDSDKLKLMSESFKPISTSQSVAVIHCAVYNNSTHEVITAGVGNITCWSFRYGGKYLMPRKIITECMEDCIVSGICLEDSQSKSQRCFLSTGSSIASFNILEGKCLSFRKNRHAREITTLTFFNPRKNLVTAAKDGSIKVWNDDGGLEIAFVGHHGSVNALAVYPFGQFIVSASSDMTIRVWSLKAKDEVDKMQCDNPVEGIGTVAGNDNLYSFTSEGIDLWKIKHIHTACTLIGSKIKSTKQTTHPKVPIRIVCICGDAAVRIVSGGTGELLTTMLVPDLTSITDAVYSAQHGLLFTLLINGKILKNSTLTNPCSLIDVWQFKGSRSPCTCLCLYEYIVEDIMVKDAWKSLVNIATQQNSSLQSESNDRTLLLGGCVNGRIVVFDWKDKKNPGKITFEIEAHRDEIVNMTSNPKIDQVVSSGLDNIVKVWRLFPFAEEALAPLMTLHFDELPRHLCISHHRLLVSLYERSRANYAITVYKTTQKERFDHSTEDDHSDEVISVTSCPKMRLFASASLDGSVRIWDESCRLRRIIKLNATPSSLCFSSERGDLIVAIGDFLHKIKYATYMPQSYVYRMVGMNFKDFMNDSVIPFDEKILKSLSTVDKQRLMKARSFSSKFTHDPDALPEEESAEKQEEAMRRALALEKIQERESDLKKLLDGELHSSKKKPKMDEGLQNEVFEKYLSLFYKRTSVCIPVDSDEESESMGYQEKDTYVPDRQPTGFFSINPQLPLKFANKNLNVGKDVGEETARDDHNEACIPNRLRSKSLPIMNEPKQDQNLVQENKKAVLEDTSIELSGERTITPPVQANVASKTKLESSWKCKHRLRKGIVVGKSPGGYPSATKPLQDVSREITELAVVEDENGDQYEALVIAPDGCIPNSVVAALFADMRAKEMIVEQLPKEVIPYKPPQLSAAQLEELMQKKTELLSPEISDTSIALQENKEKFENQLRLALRDTPSFEEFDDGQKSPTFIEESPKEKLKPAPLQDVLRPASIQPESIQPILKPLAKVQSPLPPPEPKSKPVPQPVAIIPSKKSAKPVAPVVPVVPETPASETTFLPQFIVQFKGMQWFDKIFPNANPLTFPKPWTVNAFVELLLIFLSKTTDYERKYHICAAIILLFNQEAYDNSCLKNVLKTFISELNMVNGSPSTWDSNKKKFARTALQLLRSLGGNTSDVVSEFMTYFILGDEEIRSFVVEIFSEIGIEEAKRYFLPELDEFDTWGVTENAIKTHVHNLCMTWLDKWLMQFKEHIRSLAGKINRAKSGHVIRGTKNPKTPPQVKGILKNKCKRNSKQSEVSWNFNEMGDAAAKNVTSIGAINYFSEMQLQSEIQKSRARKHSLKKQSTEDEKVRNTVLILPSIDMKPSLARLGETHCSHCHPERETSLSIGLLLPPINQQKKSIFVHSIALRLNTLTLNPFPEHCDTEIYEGFKCHDLLTLRTSQKYFIPSRSYVYTDNVK